MSKTWRYILGGAAIGALAGAVLGAELSRRLSEQQKASAMAPYRKKMDLNKTVHLGMSILDLIRQFIEIGR